MKLHQFVQLITGDHGAYRMNESSENTDQRRLETYGKTLSWHDAHDYYIAVILIIASFTVVPFIVLIIPFWLFIAIYTDGQRLDPDLRRKLRDIGHIPRNVLLFETQKFQAHIFSLPFISVLKIPEHIIKTKNEAEIALIVEHELSHHRTHDTAKIIWLLTGMALFGFVLLVGLIGQTILPPRNFVDSYETFRVAVAVTLCVGVLGTVGLVGWLKRSQGIWRSTNFQNVVIIAVTFVLGAAMTPLFKSRGLLPEPWQSVQPPPETLAQTTWFWGATILVCMFVLIALLRQVCHRTEYRADYEAAQASFDASLQYWKKRSSPKIVERTKSRLTAIYNRFIHPIDRLRYAALTGEKPITSLALFGYTLAWSFVGFTLLLRAATNGRSSYGEAILSFTNDMGLLALVVMIGIAGLGLHRMMRIHGRVFNAQSFAAFFGYASGAIGACFLVYIFERYVFELEHLRPTGTTDFILVSVVSFFPLLFLGSLASNFPKIGKLHAFAVIGLCFLGSQIVAVTTLADDRVLSAGLSFAGAFLMSAVFVIVVVIVFRTLKFTVTSLWRVARA